MTGRGSAGGVLLGLALLAAATPADAQSAGNEAWLGQVGGLNRLSITQEGRGNAAGADNFWLRLGQDGVGNVLTLDQYGHNNRLGTLFANEDIYARGVWQRGELNLMTITQRNSAAGGSNTLGSVQQWSAGNLPAGSNAFNILRVIQTAEGDVAGIGGHYVGRIVQSNTGIGAAAQNAVFILQRGGGAAEGNVLANLRQTGSGNSFGSIQSGKANRIGEIPPADGSLPIGGIVQLGTQNRSWLVQDGTSNLIEYVRQYGDENASGVRLSGNRNVISEIHQNSESWGLLATGNRVVITVSGDDNGGSGAGWVGELIELPALAVPGIAQGVFNQIGDENDISLVILSGIESKYGVTQVGDGNDAHISIAGTGGADGVRNETAVFQQGELNYVSHTVTGSNNAGAVRMEGDSNRLELVQRGSFDAARVAIEGDNNNSAISPMFGAALELTAQLATDGLSTGRILQSGGGVNGTEANTVGIDLFGSGNAFAALQSGAGNVLNATITGTGNALAVAQMGRGNTSLSSQTGAGNSLAVLQF